MKINVRYEISINLIRSGVCRRGEYTHGHGRSTCVLCYDNMTLYFSHVNDKQLILKYTCIDPVVE